MPAYCKERADRYGWDFQIAVPVDLVKTINKGLITSYMPNVNGQRAAEAAAQPLAARCKTAFAMLRSLDAEGRRGLILQTCQVHTRLQAIIDGAKANTMSLAVFKPHRVLDFTWEQEEADWDKKRVAEMREKTKQTELFAEETWRETFKLIPKLPYSFSYTFEDADGRKSSMQVLDWEIGQLYWNCLRRANGNVDVAQASARQVLRRVHTHRSAFLPGHHPGISLRRAEPLGDHWCLPNPTRAASRSALDPASGRQRCARQRSWFVLAANFLLASKPRLEATLLRWLVLDLNSFFASCEQQEHPELRGKPVIVVPTMAETTCAIAASYPAKAFGIKTGTLVHEARRLCPEVHAGAGASQALRRVPPPDFGCDR